MRPARADRRSIGGVEIIRDYDDDLWHFGYQCAACIGRDGALGPEEIFWYGKIDFNEWGKYGFKYSREISRFSEQKGFCWLGDLNAGRLTAGDAGLDRFRWRAFSGQHGPGPSER